ALYEIIDMREQGRVVTAGTSRNPAAKRRHLEGLGKVAQGQAVRLQLILEVRAEHTALNQCAAGRTINLEHLVQVRQIDTDRRDITVAAIRFDAADHG